METIDTKLVNFFNSYLFRNVWNEPSKEYRRNIKPYLMSNVVSNSTIKLDYKRYNLPTAEKYLVYFIPESTMGGITFRRFPDWTTAVDFLNMSRIELRFHNTDGIMLPRAKVFVANHPEKLGVLIAVKRSTFRAIYGDAASARDLFVALYYDSNYNNDVTINTYTLDGGTDINTVYADVQTATSVYVNGIAVDAQSVADISIANAIVEVVKDDNVLNTFEIDLADANGRRNFISDIDNEAKTIVHIPKALNPDNDVISHHTCDLWIYPRNGATANRNGRYFHRAIAEYTFTQVTHNDFAIPDIIINTYADTLNTDEFRLVVQVKNHEKDNSLVNDKNYIGLLYSHDDDTILDFLEGIGPEDFDFWKAKTLENSEYVKMISDVPDFVNVNNLPKYIGALGYYNSIALISNRIRTLELEDLGGSVSHRFITPIPVVFESIRVFPSFFVNGVKLDQSLVSVYRVQSGSVVIDIDPSVTLEVGDDVKVELFEDVPHNIVEVRPTATYNHIDVPNDDFVLYEVTIPPAAIPGIDQDYNKIYTIIEDISTVGAYVNSVSGSYIAFNAGAYNRTFVTAFNVGFEFTSYELDSMLSNNDTLVFDLATQVKSIDFEPPYEWLDHTGISSASGDVYDPNDPSATDQYPAWNVMDGNEDWDLAHRWVTTIKPEGNIAKFDLAPANQGNYWLIGYRIGAMPNMSDALRASELPINWQVRVDGNLVDAVTNEWWYLNPEIVHTHMLATPVLVNTDIEFSISSIQTDGVFQLQTDMFEPIFSDAAETIDVPYLGDITCIPYLNGKELVNGVDYHLADIQYSAMSGTPHLAGRQLVITNAAYLKESGNKLELLICHNDVDGEVQGFLQRSWLGDINASTRWFNELSQVVVDGLVTENISPLFGTIQVPSPDVIDSNMKAFFPLDADYANDKTGSYTLTPTGGVTLAIVDNKGGMVINAPDNAIIACSEAWPSDLTIAFTVKMLSAPSTVSNLVSMNDINNKGVVLKTDEFGSLILGLPGSVDVALGPVDTDTHHYALTISNNGVNLEFFVDGTIEYVGVLSEAFDTSTIKFDNVDGNGLAVFDAMIFHRKLSNTEVVQAAVISDDTRFRLGSVYGTRTLIPEKSKYFVDRYYADDDTPKLDALTEYFRGISDTSEQVVMIPYSHRIVSIRAHAIIRDMITGAIVVPYDPSDAQVLQTLSAYDYLKQYDIAFDAPTAVDPDFVDVQAMYTDQDILNANLLAQINRVIEVLIQDSVTHLRPNHEG